MIKTMKKHIKRVLWYLFPVALIVAGWILSDQPGLAVPGALVFSIGTVSTLMIALFKVGPSKQPEDDA